MTTNTDADTERLAQAEAAENLGRPMLRRCERVAFHIEVSMIADIPASEPQRAKAKALEAVVEELIAALETSGFDARHDPVISARSEQIAGDNVWFTLVRRARERTG